MPTITKCMLVVWQDRAREPVILLAEDNADFDTHAPYGCEKHIVRAIEADGRFFPLHHLCPESGFARWTLADHEAAELAADAEVMSLPAALREKFAPGYESIAARKAQRAAEDAEAAKRAKKR